MNCTFDDIKEKIFNNFKDMESLGIAETVTLVDGFIIPSLTQNSKERTIGGASVPMIMFVGNKTGRVYLFALKALDLK